MTKENVKELKRMIEKYHNETKGQKIINIANEIYDFLIVNTNDNEFYDWLNTCELEGIEF